MAIKISLIMSLDFKLKLLSSVIVKWIMDEGVFTKKCVSLSPPLSLIK